MIIYPAIDIKDGQVVRLLQGDFSQVTEYADDPSLIAKTWEKKGAEWLHIVDLDGAKTGAMLNQNSIYKIVESISIPIQVGGGIRDLEQVRELIDGGVSRVILGTQVLEDENFLPNCLSEWKDKIAVSLDCSNGFVAQRGWTKTSDVKAVDLVKKLEDQGLKCLIFTDIARDGMLTGPNFEALEEMCAATNIPIIASGGVSSIDDIKRLAALKDKGVVGAITGKALYEGKVNLKEALKIC